MNTPDQPEDFFIQDILPEPEFEPELRSEFDPRTSLDRRIVLHRSHKEAEWVTHVEFVKNSGPYYEWGHYYDNYADGVTGYLQRCKRSGLNPNLPEALRLQLS